MYNVQSFTAQLCQVLISHFPRLCTVRERKAFCKIMYECEGNRMRVCLAPKNNCQMWDVHPFYTVLWDVDAFYTVQSVPREMAGRIFMGMILWKSEWYTQKLWVSFEMTHLTWRISQDKSDPNMMPDAAFALQCTRHCIALQWGCNAISFALQSGCIAMRISRLLHTATYVAAPLTWNVLKVVGVVWDEASQKKPWNISNDTSKHHYRSESINAHPHTNAHLYAIQSGYSHVHCDEYFATPLLGNALYMHECIHACTRSTCMYMWITYICSYIYVYTYPCMHIHMYTLYQFSHIYTFMYTYVYTRLDRSKKAL